MKNHSLSGSGIDAENVQSKAFERRTFWRRCLDEQKISKIKFVFVNTRSIKGHFPSISTNPECTARNKKLTLFF